MICNKNEFEEKEEKKRERERKNFFAEYNIVISYTYAW